MTTMNTKTKHALLFQYPLPDVHLYLHMGVLKLLQAELVLAESDPTLRTGGGGTGEDHIHTGLTAGRDYRREG